MHITKLDVAAEQHLVNHLASKDAEMFLSILQGATVPHGYDLAFLLERVELWENKELYKRVISGNLSWAPVLMMNIYDAFGRKWALAMTGGEYWRLPQILSHSAWAFAAAGLVVIRIFLHIPGYAPLRTVLTYTSIAT